MAELTELVVLIAFSLVLVVGVIFRPTDAGISRRGPASQPGQKLPETSSDGHRQGKLIRFRGNSFVTPTTWA